MSKAIVIPIIVVCCYQFFLISANPSYDKNINNATSARFVETISANADSSSSERQVPEITKVFPEEVKQGEKLGVSITGTNTSFCFFQGTAVINNIDGVYVKKDTFTIASPNWDPTQQTSVEAQFSIPVDAPLGSYILAVIQKPNSDTILLKDGLTITDKPAIISIEPDRAEEGETLSVEITGNNTEFWLDQGAVNNVKSVYFEGENRKNIIAAKNYYPTSKTTINATFAMPWGVPFYGHKLHVIQISNNDTASYDNDYYFCINSNSRPRLGLPKPRITEQGENFSTLLQCWATTFVTIQGNDTVENVRRILLKNDNVSIESSGFFILSSTKLRAEFPIPDNVPVGQYHVTVEKKNDSVIACYNGLIIKESLDPEVGPTPNLQEQGNTFTMTISGNEETRFQVAQDTVMINNVNTVQLMNGNEIIIPDSFTVDGEHHLLADFSIPESATVGFYELLVIQKANNDTALCKKGFHILQKSTPSIIRTNPDSVLQGTESVGVWILGYATEFVIEQGDSTIPNVSRVYLRKETSIIEGTIGTLKYKGNFSAQFDFPFTKPLGLYDVLVELKSSVPITPLQGRFRVLETRPALIAPLDRTDGVFLASTFTWHSMPGALAYQLTLARDIDFSEVVVDSQDIKDTTIVISQLTGNTPYFWHVKAITSSGSSPYSDIWSFITEPVFHMITAQADSHGTITPSGFISVLENMDKTFEIIPDSAYIIKEIFIDGSSIGDSSFYTFPSVTSGHTIRATFIPHTAIIFNNTKDNSHKKTTHPFIAIPNPVNTHCNLINFYFAADELYTASMRIYDAVGNLVHKSKHTITPNNENDQFVKFCSWNLKKQNDIIVAAGSYLAVLETIDKDGSVMVFKAVVGIKK